MNPLAYHDMWLTLDCVRCGQQVQVMEIPAGHLDRRRYVCGCCLEERNRGRHASPLASTPAPTQPTVQPASEPVPYNTLPF